MHSARAYQKLTISLRLVAFLAAALPVSIHAQPKLFSESSPAFSDVLQKAQNGKFGEALEDLTKEIADIPGPVRGFVAAGILEDAGQTKEAIDTYLALADTPLADIAHFKAGSLMLKDGDTSGARAALGTISMTSGSFVSARLLLAKALLAEGRPAAAEVVINDLLEDELPGKVLFSARMLRVDVTKALGNLERAHSEAFLAWLYAPNRSCQDKAGATLQEMDAPILPAHLKLRELIHAKGKALKTMGNAARKRPKALKKIDPGLPHLISGIAHRAVRKTRAKAVEDLELAVSVAVDPWIKDYAAFSLGRALVLTNDDPKAFDVFMELLGGHGPFAADAAFEASKAATRLKKPDEAEALLTTCLKEHPEGGYGPEIRWELALNAMVYGEFQKALDIIESALTRLDFGDCLLFGQAERFRYFRAVALERLGRSFEAKEELMRVASGDPWSYYGVLAASKLQGMDTQLDDLGLKRQTDESNASLGAIWMGRLGMTAKAREQLITLAYRGMLNTADIQLLLSMGISSRHHREFFRGGLDSDVNLQLTDRFKRPFLNEVQAACEQTGVDPALIYAVMQVESGFNPRARSSAGAIGLMQLLRTTARNVATISLQDPKLARTVGRPSSNIMLGAALLQELESLFQGHLPLVLVGYHAGSGSGKRFHRNFRHLSTDLLVEVLPFRQTTRYIKRVISLTAGYRALFDADNQGPLRLPLFVPNDLGPFLEKRPPEV